MDVYVVVAVVPYLTPLETKCDLGCLGLFSPPPRCSRNDRSIAHRKRHAGDRLRGPALANLKWALTLEEGWEERYARTLEAGDGWAALHRLR